MLALGQSVLDRLKHKRIKKIGLHALAKLYYKAL